MYLTNHRYSIERMPDAYGAPKDRWWTFSPCFQLEKFFRQKYSPLADIEKKMAATTAATPGVLWAQRPKLIFLTLDVSDCKDHQIQLEKDSLHFRGRGGPDAKDFEITMKFLKEIDPEKSKYAVRPRAIEFALGKILPSVWMGNGFHA